MIAARIDTTHTELVKVLRRLGWLIFDTHRLPNFVDAIGYHRSHGVVLFEFKTTEKSKLRPSQEKLIAFGWPLTVMWSMEQAIAFTRQGKL